MEAFLLALKYEMQIQFLGCTKKEPLDKLLSKCLHENDKCDCLWKASVERGFSVNKEVVAENNK